MVLTDDDLRLRRLGISATDATTIAGVSPYGRTVHDVYLDKMGLAEPHEQTAAMSMGHRLEPVALAVLAEERDLIVTPGHTEQSPDLPWVIASPDGNVLERADGPRVAVAEAKAVGFRMAQRWGENGDPDAIPDEVRVQVQWQMIATKTRCAHVVALIGTEARFYDVEHDEELAAALLDLCEKFYRKHVVGKLAPEIDGSESSARMVRSMFRKATAGIVAAPPEAEALVREYLAAQQNETTASERFEAVKAQLCALIGEHEGLQGGEWLATWKSRAGSTDWKALALKLGATKELEKQYKRDGSRVLLVKTNRKQEAA